MGRGRTRTVVLGARHVADSHWLREVLESSGDYAVVAEAGDGLGVIDQVIEHRPDVVIIDMLMHARGITALEAIPSVLKRSPGTVLVLLADGWLRPAVRLAQRLGASGHIDPHDSDEAVLDTVRHATAPSGNSQRSMIIRPG